MPLGWAMILVCLQPIQGDAPRVSWVDAEFVELLDEPDDAAYSTGRLLRGQKVTIRREGPPGWATLDPPPGSFSYIDQAEIEEGLENEAKVSARYASVRPGRNGAKLPGPPRVSLREGTRVRLIDRRPLVIRRDGEIQTWLAITPPRAEVRFVRIDSLTDMSPVEDQASGSLNERQADRVDQLDRPSVKRLDLNPRRPSSSRIEVDRRFISIVAPSGDVELSTELESALGKTTVAHRQILRGPLEQWDLASIQEDYERQVRGASPTDQRALKARIDQVKRQRTAAEAANRMEQMIAKSRDRDRQITAIKGSKILSGVPSNTYDATGLLQTSSRTVDGTRVHVLLGGDGSVVAYLRIPPGISTKGLLSQDVGVRGEGRYDEGLRFKLINVRDLEALPKKERGRVLLSY